MECMTGTQLTNTPTMMNESDSMTYTFTRDELASVWFTSDSHLGHRRILELGEGRPFSDIEEHDSAIASRWSSVIGPEDTVFHLGDVVLGDWLAGLGLLRGLNGHKLLVPGNHDRVFSREKPQRREVGLREYSKTFEKILPEEITVDLAGTVFKVSHFPITEVYISGRADRYADCRPMDDGTPIIHGHTHQAMTITRTSQNTVQVSVGVDANDWTPVNALAILEALEDSVDSNA